MTDSPLDAALDYAAHGGPVFPCRETEPGRKKPYTGRGFYDASRDPATISAWWRHWPAALIGMPTGRASGRVVLDIDVKDPRANGFDTLEDLGIVLPPSPMVHTASGGLHVYFDAGDRELRNSAGLIGPGIDTRGDGGFAIVPSPGSRYTWDPIYGPDTPLAPAPEWLWPHRPSRPAIPQHHADPADLGRYAAAAIESACEAIVRAGTGKQEKTLNAECYSIGTLAGSGLIPVDIALRALLSAASTMPDHDPSRPWRAEEVEAKVRRAFEAGQRKPREVRRAVA